MKVKYIRRGEYKCKPIIEIHNIATNIRSCNCCNCNKGIRQDLRLGCDNYSMSICICDQCLVILHDMIGEYLEERGGI